MCVWWRLVSEPGRINRTGTRTDRVLEKLVQSVSIIIYGTLYLLERASRYRILTTKE
jgi:hypothetical protein